MFNFFTHKKDEPLQDEKKRIERKKQTHGFLSQLFRIRIEGTVAEPWPTAEELYNDPEVKREIKKVNDAFNGVKNKK